MTRPVFMLGRAGLCEFQVNDEDEVAAGWPNPQLSMANVLVLGPGMFLPSS